MTQTPTRAEWLIWRRGAGDTLGATDCAVILCDLMGWPSFRTPGDLYTDRWHGRPEEARYTAATARLDAGNALEPYVLTRWHVAHGHGEHYQPGPWLELAAYPWWRGSLDCAPVDRTILDAKTTTWAESGHWYDADDRPVWPPAYLCQLAQYAVAAQLAGYDVDRVALAMLDLAKVDTLHERTALLTDPVDLHIDPALAVPSHDDGRPFTVEDLGLAAIAAGASFRTRYLTGDAPPEPPPSGPLVSWWTSKPRPAKSSRPTTPEEAEAIASYADALAATKNADAAKDIARATIARSMSASEPVARIYGDTGSASISAAGRLTITPKKDAPPLAP